MKTKIFVIGVLLIAVLVFATGAFAYFTTQKTTTVSTISTGKLDMQLGTSANKDTEPTNWGDSVPAPWEFDKMVPGKKVSGCLWVKNTGTVDIIAVTWDFKNLNTTPGPVNLADRLQITDLYTTDSLWDWPEALLPGGAWYAGGIYDRNSDGKISLADMASWSDVINPAQPFDWLNDDPSKPFLLTVAPGNVGYICMDIEMMNGTPAVDNPYQGQTFTYQVEIIGFNPSPY